MSLEDESLLGDRYANVSPRRTDGWRFFFWVASLTLNTGQRQSGLDSRALSFTNIFEIVNMAPEWSQALRKETAKSFVLECVSGLEA